MHLIACRWHLCRPRSIIPSQRVHPSVFYADIYTPHATLGNSARNSIVLRRPSDLLDTTAPLDERARTWLLESLLKDQQTTLGSLEKVLFLVDSLNYETADNGQTRTIPRPQWTLSGFQGLPFAKYALTVVYDATSQVPVSEELLDGARKTLCTVLQSSPDHTEFTPALYILRFSAKYPRLRQRFIDDDVTRALTAALEWTSKSPSEIQFPLVTDSLCYLIADENLRGGVVNWFRDGTETAQTRILDVKVPTHLMASLKMIARLAEHHSDLCERFKPRLYELAKKKGDSFGSAAVNALVAMRAPFTRDIYICNTLGYLSIILPPLDVEVDSSLSHDDTDEFRLPTVRWVNDMGVLNQEFMLQLVSTITSRNVHERTQATLTLLKLCRDAMVRGFCTQKNVLDIFVSQLKQKKTSLLAAYALRKCLEYDMCTSDHNLHAAPALVSMVNKNWFDDAIGRMEGCEIFRGLMTSVDLREKVLESDIVPTLIKMLASGERNQTRMSLIFIDVLDEESSLKLKYHVEKSIGYLKDENKDVRMKGVKIISALAQTMAGERAIKERLKGIIEILPEASSDGRALSRPKIVGAIAVLYNLSKNETLREHIQRSPELISWKACRRQATLGY
ncbi:hypothetical protein JVU11DRAFT_9606 [Chiua virens]|nr:hypothetical protein JVU11DRAFT_9606 [Chiua virens]